MERVNYDEFANLIPHLKLSDLLLTEYRINEWNFLVKTSDANKKAFICNLCGVSQVGETTLKSHINGKKHKFKMRAIRQFYHPQYTYNKDIAQSGKNKHKTIMQNNKSITKMPNQIDKCIKDSIQTNSEPVVLDVEAPTNKKIVKNPFSQENINSKKVAEPEKTQEVTFNDVIIIDEEELPPVKNVIIKENIGFADKSPVKKSPKQLKIQAKNSVKQQEIKNTPHYQSNIIVVPTKLKDKVQTNIVNSTNSSNSISSGKTPGLIGVEYVIKILKNYGDKRPKYECGLCELSLDGVTMQNHLLGYNHRLKFCEKHFPSAVNYYRKFMESVPEYELFKVMTPILSKLAKAIEEHHGRDKPFECQEREYSSNRQDILLKVFSLRHASEKHGPTFTHVLDAKEIDHLIESRHNYKPASNTFIKQDCFDIDLCEYEYQSTTEPNLITMQQPSTEPNFIAMQQPIYSTQYQPESQAFYQPQFQHQQPSLLNQEQINYNHNTQKYDAIDDETHKLLVENFLNENNNYDRCRRHELPNKISNDLSNKHVVVSRKQENNTPPTYRYSVDEKIKQIEIDFDIFRNDPESYPSYEEEWHIFWKRRKDELIAKGIDHRKYNYQPEWVCFFKDRIEKLCAERIENVKEEARAREQARIAKEVNKFEKKNNQKQRIENEYIDILQAKAESNRKRKIQDESTETKRVVPVLRLLTALEEYLGSLGPKMIETLSRALQLEKTNPTQVDRLIMTADTLAFLEIVKEKFKGLLMTGTLDQTSNRAINKAINTLEDFLNYAENAFGVRNIGDSKKCKHVKVSSYFSTPISSNSKIHQTSIVGTLDEDNVSTDRSSNINTISSILKNSMNNNNRGNTTGLNSLKPINDTNKPKPCEPTFSKLLSNSENKELAMKVASALTAQGKNFDLEQLQQLVGVYKIIEMKKRLTGTNISSSDVQQLNNTPCESLSSDTMRNILEVTKETTMVQIPHNQQPYQQSPHLQNIGSIFSNPLLSIADGNRSLQVQSNKNFANVLTGYRQNANNSDGDYCSTQYVHNTGNATNNQHAVNYCHSNFPHSNFGSSSMFDRNLGILGMSGNKGLNPNTSTSQNDYGSYAGESHLKRFAYSTQKKNNI